MNNKPEMAQRFLSALTGESSPSMWWQTFCDFEKRVKDPFARRWEGQLNPAYLDEYQKVSYGVFYSPNGGGRNAEEINNFRAVFMDSDGVGLPAQWPVNPHAMTKRDDTHYHAYWFIDGDCTADEWRYAQRQIALYFGSDETMVNPDRVLRVPGYTHFKDLNNPVSYDLVYLDDTLPRYKLRDIIQYFPLSAEKQSELVKWVDQQKSKLIGGIEDYADTTANCAEYIKYLTQRAEHGVDGEGRNAIRFKTAAAGRDYGISPQKTVELMLQYWDHGNTPPCGEDLIIVSVNNAYRYTQNAMGNRSLSKYLDTPAIALPGMSSEPVTKIVFDIPVPSGNAKPVKENLEVKRAELIAATAPGAAQLQQGDFTRFYGKNHALNSETFLAQHSPNGEFVLSNDELFVFNGKIYQKTDIKLLHSMMKTALQMEMPSISDINGAVEMVKIELRNHSPERWPMWKHARERDTKNLIVFDNGALDLETNEWFEHSSALLANNYLPFSYDHTATCPTWEKFMRDTWGDTDLEPLIEGLQKWFGYLITNDCSQQKMAYFIGQPRSGKGTIMRVIQNMLGSQNVASPDLAGLLSNSTLHSMSDKMAAIFNDVSDVSNGRAQVVERIKKITGQDTMNVDRKYMTAIDLEFRCRLMLTCNKLPAFSETSTAMIDRGIFFYLEESHSGKEDMQLTDKLIAELPGIINWAILGLQKLRADGGRLTNPKCVHERIDAFRLMSGPFEMFMRDHLVKSSETLTPIQELYARYQSWMSKHGRAVSMIDFSRELCAAPGVTMIGKGGGLMVKGYTLKPEFDSLPPEYKDYDR